MSEFCRGFTKSGEQCRITSNLVDGYCRLHSIQGKGRPAADAGAGAADMVLERTPETGIPRYVSCAEDPRSRWMLVTVVAVVALLSVAFTVLFCGRRNRCR